MLADLNQWFLSLGAEYGVGQNIPVWVWIFLAVLVVCGAWSTIRDTRRKIAAARAEGEA